MAEYTPNRPEIVAPGETSEVPTRWRRGDRQTLDDGTVLEFIEAEIEGEKWQVIGSPGD